MLFRTAIDRTVEGIHALRAATVSRPARRNPARIAYLAAGATSIAAAATRADRVTRVVKPLLMPLLGASLFNKDATPSRRAVLAIGLGAAWLGDITLMKAESRDADPQVRARNVNAGAAFFSVNQLAYLWLLSTRGARPSAAAVAARIPVLAAGAGLAAWRAPAALPAAGAYGTVLAATSALGEDRSIIRGTVEDFPQDYGISHGGNLFVISDALILARLAGLKDSQAPGAAAITQVADGFLDAAVMGTYVVAQLLLAEGLIAK